MKSFVDYMVLLLPAPLKRAPKSVNRFIVFCQFSGKLFDEAMEQLFHAREQTKILSCAPEVLSEHGRERGVPRFEGESTEAYRARLIAQFDIAKKAGTTDGIKLAIQSLGYRNIFLEPVRKTYPERWAEFFVWVSDKAELVPINIALLHQEVSKVKRATSKAAYGLGTPVTVTRMGAFGGLGAFVTVDPYIPEAIEPMPIPTSLSSSISISTVLTVDYEEDNNG